MKWLGRVYGVCISTMCVRVSCGSLCVYRDEPVCGYVFRGLIHCVRWLYSSGCAAVCIFMVVEMV